MSIRTILVSLLSGFLCLLWSNVSWMALKLHKPSINAFKDPLAVQQILLDNMQAGKQAVYAVPSLHDKKSPKLEGGPSAFIAITPLASGFNPIKLVREFAYSSIIALILAMLINYLSISSVKDRFVLVFASGLTTTIASSLPNWNWWGYAWDYTSIGMLDSVIYTLITGSILAFLLKR